MMEKPILSKEEVMLKFGDCKYSCQQTNESTWFHTIKKDEYTIFIEEWDDDNDNEVCSTIFTEKKKQPSIFSGYNVHSLVQEILDFINKY